MTQLITKQIIESLLMASNQPVAAEKLHRIIATSDNSFDIKQIKDIINELANDYSGSAIELKEVASGWRFQIKPDYSGWIAKLYEEKPPRYSHAFLETLALIAYRQPITRAEIEEVRGVAVSSNIMRTLLDHEWVKVVGHKETPGRPALFATTKKFLDHFNLKSLDELPPLIEFTETLKGEAAEGEEGIEEELTDKVQLTVQAEESENLFNPYGEFSEIEHAETE